jgi:transposase
MQPTTAFPKNYRRITVTTSTIALGLCSRRTCLHAKAPGAVSHKTIGASINAIFSILRTSAPWRDLLPDYVDWKNTHRRFCRWRDQGLWESLLQVLINEPDCEWLMIDASHAKVHPHAARARGGNQAMGRTKGGL